MTRSSSDPISTSRGMRTRVWLALGAVSLLAACHAQPTGQAVAKIDGKEITLSDLNAEIATMQVPANADKKLVQRQALEQIVERKLLANAARQDGMDQNPEFIVRRQQLEDALLVQLLAKKVASGIKIPAAGDIDKFMAGNTNMFAGRAILTTDQIQFDAPTRDDYLKQLQAAHSMTDVVAVLDRLGIKYQRQNAPMDTAVIPPQMLAKIRGLPTTEPFIIPAGNKVVVGVVTDSRPAALEGEQARPIAINAVRNTQLGSALQQRLRTEKAKAKIEYQTGFGPPPAAATGASPTTAPGQ